MTSKISVNFLDVKNGTIMFVIVLFFLSSHCVFKYKVYCLFKIYLVKNSARLFL